MRYDIEMTDTFGGEANYCWVRRAEIEVPDGTDTSRIIVRRAKKALGITGRHKLITASEDLIRLDLAGACICIFITPTHGA